MDETTPPPPLPSRAAAAAPEAVRPTVVVSLLAGLCPLIPLPFVDDWVEGIVRRRAVRDLLREHGVDPAPADVEVLAGLERPAASRGCLKRAVLWPVLKLVWYVARKITRKVVFVLAANDAANAASGLFHDVWLLRLALDRGALGAGPDGRLDRERSRRVRTAVDAALGEGDARPLERALRRALAGSGALLRSAARHLGRWARGERGVVAAGSAGQEEAARDLPLEEEERRLSGLVDRLVDAVWLERGYLAGVEGRFLAHLEAAGTPASPPPSPAPGP